MSERDRVGATGALVALSHALGAPEHDLVILAEGNTSALTRAGHFLVKASGVSLASSAADDFVELRWEPLLAALHDRRVTPADVPRCFAEASPSGAPPRSPSTETFIHAVGYGACGATWIAHTHPTPATALLSSSIADADLKAVLFPDEAVVAGAEPALVGYADPGLELGREMLREVQRYQDAHGRCPRLVLLRNHGIVVFGTTAQEVLAASLMATKAARVRLGALAAGGLRPLPPGAAAHLAGRSDERARLIRIFEAGTLDEGPAGAAR